MRRTQASINLPKGAASIAGVLGVSALCLLVAATASACGEGCRAPVDPCAALAAGAEPHLSTFERFVPLAERVLGSDSAFSDRGQLEESLFSSLRGEPAVLAAWVERTGAAPILLTLPSVGPPLEATFTTCRLAGSERIEAARGEVHIGEAPGPAFFLRRRISRPPQTLTITLAFIDEPESPAP